jgi:hypothetical protein
VRIDNDCVNGLGGTCFRSQGQNKENKALFHVPFNAADAPTEIWLHALLIGNWTNHFFD